MARTRTISLSTAVPGPALVPLVIGDAELDEALDVWEEALLAGLST